MPTHKSPSLSTHLRSNVPLRLQDKGQPQREPKTYPWLFFANTRAFRTSAMTGVVMLVLSWAGTTWYASTHPNPQPRDPLGVTLGLGAAICIALTVGYYVQRRSKRRVLGRLNALLQWHSVFALLGLSLAIFHSFGHTEHISGDIALYSLVALTISGFVGRILDRILPRLMAQEVNKALTANGDEMLASMSHRIFTSGGQEITWPQSLLHFVIRGELTALYREQRYRLFLQLWRTLHRALALVAGATLCWHIVYGVQVLLGH